MMQRGELAIGRSTPAIQQEHRERALFVIDKAGIIAWSYCSPIAVNPGADGILQALEVLPK